LAFLKVLQSPLLAPVIVNKFAKSATGGQFLNQEKLELENLMTLAFITVAMLLQH
jgi:hypothetical protein